MLIPIMTTHAAGTLSSRKISLWKIANVRRIAPSTHQFQFTNVLRLTTPPITQHFHHTVNHTPPQHKEKPALAALLTARRPPPNGDGLHPSLFSHRRTILSGSGAAHNGASHAPPRAYPAPHAEPGVYPIPACPWPKRSRLSRGRQ